MERKLLCKVCKKGINNFEYRKELWLRASGARSAMSLPENSSYYKRLKELVVDYPNPSFSQIELDLKRTFVELKISKSEHLIAQLRNVLMTYAKRNATIGYCQGMNFLVGLILKVFNSYTGESPADLAESESIEEKAFWTFTMLLESILPLDYYSNMVGVLIDQKIFYTVFQ
jgi:hypothetical protein